MKHFIFVIGLLLPSGLFAQVHPTEAYYRQAAKKFDSVKTLAPDSILLPSVKELEGSPAANEYLYRETVAAFRWEGGHHPDKDELQRWIVRVFGMPIDSFQRVSVRLGDYYLVWLYARHLLSPAVQERYLLYRVDRYTKEESLPLARQFLSDLAVYFPRSRRMHAARAKVQALEVRVMAGKNNVHVLFRGAVHSLDALLLPYKGKVVYLDIWGTWCGPCLEEMKYAAALKQHVDTAQVAFVYLDMDADENDRRWREYVQLHSITGEHLRMNREDIGVIWEALLHSDHGSYPSFFIFGRDGRVVEATAKRPSETVALYAQLQAAVDQR